MIIIVDVYVYTVLMEFWCPSKMGYSTKASDFVVLLLLFLCSALRLKHYNVKPRSRGTLDCTRECTEAHWSVLSAVWSSGICCSQSAALGACLLAFKCFSHFSQCFTQVIPKLKFCWLGTSDRRSLHSVLFQIQLKILIINLTWLDYMSPSLPWCIRQLNACAILFTSTGCLLICDSRAVSDPIAKTFLCWAIILNCVEWIMKSTFEIHNQPILYQHMFAVKQL